MLLIAVSACWLGWIVRSAHEQKQAAEAILARGGIIEYDYKYDSSRSRRLPKGESWRPLWLQRLLGDDYLHNIVVAGLDEGREPGAARVADEHAYPVDAARIPEKKRKGNPAAYQSCAIA